MSYISGIHIRDFFSTWIRYIHIFLFVAYKRPYSLRPFEDVFICIVIYLLWI
jgi:hypothetical protein